MQLRVLILSLTLFFLNNPTSMSGQHVFINWLINKTADILMNRFIGDLYDGTTPYVWPLKNYIFPDRSSPYKCPATAVKHVRDPPHDRYIVSMEKDIQDLKEKFDSLNNSDSKVSVVHVLGVPGSGKTELARQFGNSIHCKQNGSSTVLTLNTESSERFRNSLVTSIWEIMNSEHKEFNTNTKDEITVLANKLKHLLKKRPGWLLIVDNIRDPKITQKDMYKLLPTAGKNTWGTGKMLITTQIPLTFGYNEHIEVKHIKGLTLEDATNFLRKLVEQKTKRSCDMKVAEKIVKKLERLPLSILAAGDYISRRMNSSRSYSCSHYLREHEAKNILPAHGKLTSNTYGYSHAMLRALQLTIEETRNVYGDVFRDFIAFIGFINSREGWIPYWHVETFLKMREHDHVSVFDFPLVYLSQNRFQVHQVVTYAFRQALERSETKESLQYVLRKISFYLVDQYKKPKIYLFDIDMENHFHALVQHLPSQCSHLSDCLVAPEWKNEYFEAVSYMIFKRYLFEPVLNCSKLDTFLFQLGRFPSYINRVAVHTRYMGYQALYYCLEGVDKLNETFSVANDAIQLIKEVAPKHSELHTVPVSWILLVLSLQHRTVKEKWINCDTYRFLYNPIFQSHFNDGAFKIGRELCSSLLIVTKNLSGGIYFTVNALCIPDLNNSTVLGEMIALISSVYSEKGPQAVLDMLPFRLKFHKALGRSYRLGQFMETKNYTTRINPHGACYKRKNNHFLADISQGKVLKFYIDYDDKWDGLKSVEIAWRKYFMAANFFQKLIKMQRRMDETCQIVKNLSKAMYKYELTLSSGTDLKMRNEIGPIMESFYNDFVTFVDNNCDLWKEISNSILFRFDVLFSFGTCHKCKVTELLGKIRHVAGLQQDQRNEIPEVLREFIAAMTLVSDKDNHEFVIELIPRSYIGY